MLRKKIKLGEIKVVGKTKQFPEGTKFVLAGRQGTIVASEEADNTEMRTIRYDDGTEEIVMLSTLIRDSQGKDFALVGNDDSN